MKGVVFNLLEAAVSREYGDDVWDELLESAGVEGAYTSLGSYPDSDLLALVDAAARKLGRPKSEVLRWFGRAAMPVMAAQYPGFFQDRATSRDFVLGVNDVIHAEVRKLYPGADCPHFQMVEDADGALTMAYRSPRRLCALAEGFVEGVADHYGESVSFTHTQCVERGHDCCTFHIAWA